jgi:uncharacterized protein
MNQAHLRFYAELNDFLPRSRQRTDIVHRFTISPGIKDVIESLGVPHTEVDLILVNGQSVSFEYTLSDGDRVSVFPMFESLDVSGVVRVRPEPLRQTRFVLDVHLGRLARLLRLLGFDSDYRNDRSDAQLAEIAPREGRILLTRDRGLLMRKAVTHGYCVRSSRPRDQVVEVLRRFELELLIRPLTRCLECNGLLETVDGRQVVHSLPDDIRASQERFARCEACRRVYWHGSHADRLLTVVAEIQCELAAGRGGPPQTGRHGESLTGHE